MNSNRIRINEHLSRITAAVITAFVVIVSACYVGSHPLNVSTPKPRSESGPYSVLEGRTVRIQPYNATFELPESWVGPTYGKNLFLTREELATVGPTGRKFTFGEARVMEAVLPISDCAVHAGEKGWDTGSVSDQTRVYIVSMTPEEVRARIEHEGLRMAGNVFDKATYTAGNFGEWGHSTLYYFNAPTHALVFRDIDFYFHSFGDKTVVFVFHTFGGRCQTPIDS